MKLNQDPGAIPGKIPLPRPGWAVSILLLIGFVALGTYLKMLPTLSFEYEAFERDPALNYRLTEDVLRYGKLPDRDMLALYPHGRETSKYLPTIIYSITAIWVKCVRWAIPSATVQDCLLWLNAISISLVAIPVFVTAWAVSRSRCAAVLAAAFVTVTPFFNHRGSADNIRAEMMGLTFGFLAVMSWILSIVSDARKKALIHAFCAAVFLYISVGIWRMNLMIFVMITVWHIFSLPSRRDQAGSVLAYVLFASGFGASVLFQEYLRYHQAYFSVESAFALSAVALSAGFMLVCRRGVSNSDPDIRLIYQWVSVVLIAGLSLAFSLLSADKVGSAAASTFKMAVRFWGFPVRLNSDDALYEPVPELWPYDSVPLWFSGPVFSGLAVLFFAARAWRWPEAIIRTEAAGCVRVLFWITAFLSFLVAVRNLMLFIPVASVVLGIAVGLRIRPAAEGTHRRGLWIALTCVLTIMPAALIMRTYRGHGTEGAFQSDFRRTLAYIRHEVPEHEAIASSWMMGYNLQTHSGRPTITDSLIEHPEMRLRVKEEFVAFGAREEKPVVDFLRKYGVRWLLVDRSYPIIAYQQISKEREKPQLILLSPKRLKELQLELETKNLLLYRLRS